MPRRNGLRPIVLIDDDQDEIFITSWRLKKAGIENPQIVFTNPEDALRFFRQTAHDENERPALLLCDVKLPGIRGHELVAAARLQDCLREVPIWMLSNSSFRKDIAQAKAAGADGFLVKPLSLTGLRTIIEGGKPVQNQHCFVFIDEPPPIERLVHGRMEVGVNDVPALRRTMGKRGAVVAEVDRNLRYVWIDNPHADFDPTFVVGKRDDELVDSAEAAEIMSIKRRVLEQGRHSSHVLTFWRSKGWRCYTFSAYPIRSREGVVEGVFTQGVDSTYSEQSSDWTI